MSHRRILFVDDEENILDGLRRSLYPRRKEWDMTFVTSGEAALELMRGELFDFVVSDVQMPKMDGITLLGEVRKRHPQLIRIILSGYSDKVTNLRATGVAHRYLDKPCDPETLQDAVLRSGTMRDDLSDPGLLAAIAGIKSLPSVPALYHQLVEELTNEEPSLRRIGEIVSQDPAMTAKILQVVNSAFFALRRRVADIQQAVTLLGIDTIMGLVLTTHLFGEAETSTNQAAIEGVWARSLRVARLAKAIAQAGSNPPALAQEAFLAGILHDCGKLVLAATWPDVFRITEAEEDVLGAERSTVGTDHAVIGAYLLNLWGLPDDIVEAVAYHHEPSASHAAGFSPLTAVHVAQTLDVARQEGEPPQYDLEYLVRTGLDHLTGEWATAADQLAAEVEAASDR